MTERVNLGKSAPALYQAVIEPDRLAVVINAWNRIAISSRYPVKA